MGLVVVVVGGGGREGGWRVGMGRGGGRLGAIAGRKRTSYPVHSQTIYVRITQSVMESSVLGSELNICSASDVFGCCAGLCDNARFIGRYVCTLTVDVYSVYV